MRAGTNAPREAPVESLRYLPTTPLSLASPRGKRADLELSSSRADSPALAASTTTLAFTVNSCMVSVFTYDTPVQLPVLSSVSTSRTIAWVMSFRLPVLRAGLTSTDEAEKSA